MKLTNLLLFLLPLTGFSQVDTMTMNGYTCFGCDSTEFVIRYNKFITGDTLPTHNLTTSQSLNYYNGTFWYNDTYNETRKGVVETPVNVMDTGLKVETVETRDTIYKCPQSYRIYFDVNGESKSSTIDKSCVVEKIVTTRRYKLYIINEYGQKEYLSMEITKQK